VICQPMMVGAQSDDITWNILSPFHTRLDPVLSYMELEFTIRNLTVFWD
jgi:hypothetical protein